MKEKKKLLKAVLWVLAVCLVGYLIYRQIPRRVSSLMPKASEVEQCQILVMGMYADYECITLTGEELKDYLDYLDGFSAQYIPMSYDDGRIEYEEAVYHLYFWSGEKEVNIRISDMGTIVLEHSSYKVTDPNFDPLPDRFRK